MSTEKSLKQFLNKNGPKIKYESLLSSCNDNPDSLINIIFKAVNEEIDNINEHKALDRVVEILKYIEIAIGNNDNINRKIVNRKVTKLIEKLSRVLDEKKLTNIDKINNEFNKVQKELEKIIELCNEKETKQYNFINYLIEGAKDIEYLEFTLKKMPALVNVTDKDQVPLFRNLVKSYLKNLNEDNEENILYYRNLITLIMSQKCFSLSEIEKRKVLEEIYKCINKMSFNKKSQKKNYTKLEMLKEFVDVIKSTEEKKLDIDEIASKYNIEINFSDRLIEESHLNKVPMIGQMTDREEVKDYIISIDGESAVEIDDALSCKKLPNGNYLLGVHIASVLGYYPYESEIVQNAINRSQSIYLPHKYQTNENSSNRTIPIFPFEFCAKKASLLEGEKKLTRSYFFEIDKDGNIVKKEFKKTYIRNNRQLTYDEANAIIKHGTTDEKLQQTINDLLDVTKILDEKYVSTELYGIIKDNVLDTSELRVRKVGSENIVCQAMLLTGNCVAEFFYENNYPLIYRVHYVNEENNKKILAMIDSLNNTYEGNQFKELYQLINEIYPKGKYDIEGRHTGLNLDHYCHCTSVLRRAADIVVEHALEVCYDKKPTQEELQKLKDEIASKVDDINSKQHHIDYFVKEYQKKHRL